MVNKIAINGLGRIGRSIIRSIVEYDRDDVKLVAINDLNSIEKIAHLLSYDSVHGKFQGKVKVTGNTIDVGFGPIKVTNLRDPKELPWDGVDVTMECTGFFTTKEKSSIHLSNGSKRILVSAPCKDADKTIVYGVNHKSLNKDDIIVSNASCTTNCLVPIVYVCDKIFGIEKGYMTTVHSYTSDQHILDAGHSDFYRSRAAVLSMIPTSTGAAKAVELVLPSLKGKLDGSAIRVPTPNVSMVDLKFIASRNVTAAEINNAIKSYSDNELSNILGYVDLPLVSVDFNHNPCSSIFAADQTKVVSSNMVRILSWYDNEWGFSNRMLDTASIMGKFI
ncbi:type I glyceraldehyde-3-phosphate dehydrogenase [Candidatus Liberibacter americanus]|uniref:Glyceraldehyde-3-phosphate dehydrogenase n=1 Tax=Candidatus Liberibacter americanus str. Sao Paulo TaxID=1261131 RepID=U6B6N6_9HYPH|nr:type I glyceraldehyde-3-phosphate dehydrogenase [Candidatus Liberibacter americanus]AHA27407.1 Glyceraldehyde-3-phosphate dehydrogenase/erythrose-4-phosphate dehydrogenase [Candidatus Liberibacter americanus str. Sao Paulo]EMS36680.1 Glyceraldehyde 3-Phosphate Dehydrogenase [Candidatus Liberibacter americanus PW_SP]